jgi:hypothetical protein
MRFALLRKLGGLTVAVLLAMSVTAASASAAPSLFGQVTEACSLSQCTTFGNPPAANCFLTNKYPPWNVICTISASHKNLVKACYNDTCIPFHTNTDAGAFGYGGKAESSFGSGISVGYIYDLQAQVTLTCPYTISVTSSSGRTQSLRVRGYWTDNKHHFNAKDLGCDGVASSGGTTIPPKRLTTPRVKITKKVIDKKTRVARFYFVGIGAPASRGAQCSLRTIVRGKESKLVWKKCSSGVRYTKLVNKRRYVFFVRAGNAAGWGKAASYRFVG